MATAAAASTPSPSMLRATRQPEPVAAPSNPASEPTRGRAVMPEPAAVTGRPGRTARRSSRQRRLPQPAPSPEPVAPRLMREEAAQDVAWVIDHGGLPERVVLEVEGL